jgi:RWD domain
VETVVLPSTAADEEQQFVTVTLNVELPPGYPDVSPLIRLRNPRGLDDDLLAKIMTEAKAKCDDYIGQPVIYELIEVKIIFLSLLFCKINWFTYLACEGTFNVQQLTQLPVCHLSVRLSKRRRIYKDTVFPPLPCSLLGLVRS